MGNEEVNGSFLVLRFFGVDRLDLVGRDFVVFFLVKLDCCVLFVFMGGY